MDINKRVVQHRRWFHRHPELGFMEFKTSEYIVRHLEEVGIPYKKVKTGVIANIDVGASETIAFRADIDALPIQEIEGREYGSQTPGRMHACGHDAHAAMLLTASEYMMEVEKPKKNVRLVFQPAEETINGACEMIRSGAVDGVNMIFGIHVWIDEPSGVFAVSSGSVMAGSDEISITIRGSGGHAAFPQKTVNPIAIGAMLVNELYKIRVLNIDPLQSAVTNITSFNSGNNFNVVPEEARILGTIRTFSKEVREDILGRIEKLKDAAFSLGATMEVDIEDTTPPVINSENAVDYAKDVIDKLKLKVVEVKPTMGAEDFAFYLKHVPGAFLFLGIRSEEKGIVHPHHSPQFDVDEDVLSSGVKFFLACAGVRNIP